jgi:hypothetical protein
VGLETAARRQGEANAAAGVDSEAAAQRAGDGRLTFYTDSPYGGVGFDTLRSSEKKRPSGAPEGAGAPASSLFRAARDAGRPLAVDRDGRRCSALRCVICSKSTRFSACR